MSTEKETLIANVQTCLHIAYKFAEVTEPIETLQEEIDNLISQKIALQNKILFLKPAMWLSLAVLVLGFLALLTDGGSFLFIIGFTCTAISCIGYSTYKDAVDKLSASIPEKETLFKQKLDELASIMESSEDYQFLRKTIPERYATIDALEFILEVLTELRADTLKEALNLYEQHLEQVRLMEAQGQIIDLTQQNVQLSSQIAANQGAMIRQQKKLSKQVRFSNALSVINLLTRKK